MPQPGVGEYWDMRAVCPRFNRVIITGLLLGLLPSCSSGGTAKPIPTSSTMTTLAMAEVVGQLHVAGGPAPGIDKPIPGRIELHRDSQAGEIVGTAQAGDDGTFRLTVVPGTYELVAISPRVVLGRQGTPCGGTTASLHAGPNPAVTVYCLIP